VLYPFGTICLADASGASTMIGIRVEVTGKEARSRPNYSRLDWRIREYSRALAALLVALEKAFE